MKIWFLVGQSGTGKDTIQNKILNTGVDLNRLIYCTTRSKRENEENGKTYWFKTDEEYLKDLENGKVVESRCYHLLDKDVYYYTLKDIDTSKDYIVVGTIEQCLNYINCFGSSVVKPVKIIVNAYERLIRGIERERQNKEDYYEVCRRFCSDYEEYTDENFSKLNFVLEVENNDLDDCCDKLKEFIQNYNKEVEV